MASLAVRALPYVVRLARSAKARRYAAVGAAKFVTWANRYKIQSGYNKYVKPVVRRVNKRVSSTVSRASRRGMRAYRKYTPKSVRYAMANW